MAQPTMRAWIVDRPGQIAERPLRLVERPIPTPGRHEVRVRVSVCGVCRTDLHLAEGDLIPRRRGVVPGHEVVGVVDEVGDEVSRWAVGQRVGIAWLRWTCGVCRFCVRGHENLCVAPRFTGWDDDGGYAEYAVVHQDYAYPLPHDVSDEEAAPLLCAGIIGYRALRRSHLPGEGRLGLYGFGASAHLAAQVALSEGADVYVMTRKPSARDLAVRLGATWVGDATDAPPERLDSAILFAPAGSLVPVALAALDRGGTLAIAGIHLSDIPELNYDRHLFYERNLCTVTANTRVDGASFLSLASMAPLTVVSDVRPFEEAENVLRDLAEDRITGVAVIRVAS